MSVQSEITRLQNAKAAIKAAIEGKGVTVPDTTLLDGMAALIESIEAGGGGGDTLLGYNLLSGTITLAEETTSVIRLVEGSGAKEESYGICVLWHSDIKFLGGVLDNYVCVSASTGGTSFGITSKGNNAYTRKMMWVDDTGTLELYQNSTYMLKPGVMYCWIMLYKT